MKKTPLAALMASLSLPAGNDRKEQTVEVKAEVRDLAAPATMDKGHGQDMKH